MRGWLSQNIPQAEHRSCSDDFNLFPATSLFSSPSTEGEAGSVVELSALPSDGKSLTAHRLGLDLIGDGQLLTSRGRASAHIRFPQGEAFSLIRCLMKQNCASAAPGPREAVFCSLHVCCRCLLVSRAALTKPGTSVYRLCGVRLQRGVPGCV